MLACARDLPSAAVSVIKRHIKPLKLKPEKSGGASKTRLNHAFELEVWLHLSFIKIMLRHTAFSSVVAPIPRRQIAVDTFRAHHLSKHRSVRLGLRFSGLPDIHQQLAHSSGSLRHFGFQFVIGKASVTQKARTLFPQSKYFGADRTVVCCPSIGAARRPGLKGFLA